MNDPIETRLSRYFSELRPNAPMPAERRLIAALDRAAENRSPGGWLGRLAQARHEVAFTGLAVLAVIVIAGSLALRGVAPDGSWGGGSESGPSPSGSDAIAATSPSAEASDQTSPAASQMPSASAIASPGRPGVPGTFSPTGKMTTTDNGTAVLLLDGRVLIVGSGATSPELYDPKTGQFTRTGEAAVDGYFGSATRLADGRVLFVGGSNDTSTLASAQIYDPSTGKFSPTGSLIQGRQGHTATLLNDGRVLIAGGETYNAAARRGVGALAYGPSLGGNGTTRTMTGPDMLASAELYDPNTGKFTATGSMTTGRDMAGAALLPDGRVLIAGGGNEGNAAIASAELYDPKTGKFTSTGSMSGVRYAFNTTVLLDGRVFVSSGNDGNGPVYALDIYDPQTGKFTQAGSVPVSQGFATAALLLDGRVLITGGYDTAQGKLGGYVADCQVFDPSTGKLSPTGSMATGRIAQSATTLLDGRVLVTGGVGAGDPNQLDSAELYQP
jgi:hypothetical protein